MLRKLSYHQLTDGFARSGAVQDYKSHVQTILGSATANGTHKEAAPKHKQIEATPNNDPEAGCP